MKKKSKILKEIFDELIFHNYVYFVFFIFLLINIIFSFTILIEISRLKILIK